MLHIGEESYATVFSEAHSSILESISTTVEEPPLGPFNHKALKWDFVFRHYRQQHESMYVMQCYIPLNRVSDFVIGEESLPGENCKYVRTRIINNTRHGLLQPRSDSALYVDKCGLHLLLLYVPDTLSTTFAASTFYTFLMYILQVPMLVWPQRSIRRGEIHRCCEVLEC